MITGSLNAWAESLNKDAKTLKGHLLQIGHVPKAKEILSADLIFRAMVGDKYAEEVRALKLDNEEREREAAKDKRELVSMSEVEKVLTEAVLWPLSQALIEAKATNKAEAAWIDETMKRIRDGLPKERL